MTGIPQYIGVTGPRSVDELKATIDTAARLGVGPSGSVNLMCGCLVSPTTLSSTRAEPIEPILSNRPNRHVESLEDLIETLQLAAESKVVGMVHFELRNGDVPHKLAHCGTYRGTAGHPEDPKDVIALLKRVNDELPAPIPVQLNGVVSPKGIEEIAKETGSPIVLQARAELTGNIDQESLKNFLHYLGEIKPYVSNVLMDASGGTGAEIDSRAALEIWNAIDSEFQGEFSPGFAGGLGGISDDERARTSEIISQICQALGRNDIDFDNESKSRDPETDELSQEYIHAYLDSAQKGLKTAIVS